MQVDAATAAAAEEDDAGPLPVHGLLYAAALVGLGFLGSLAETHSFFQLNLAGMKAKTALTSAIFRKSLNMKHPRGKSSKLYQTYRVSHLVANLGWVGLNLGSSLGWFAIQWVATAQAK